MDFGFTPTEVAWRQQIRDFLRAELPPDWGDRAGAAGREEADWVFQGEFRRRLAERGWIAIAWPKAYGGQERSFIEQMIYSEEMSYGLAPLPGLAVTTIGP